MNDSNFTISANIVLPTAKYEKLKEAYSAYQLAYSNLAHATLDAGWLDVVPQEKGE